MNIPLANTPIFSEELTAVLLFAFENERLAGPKIVGKLLKQLTNKEFNGAETQQLLLYT